MLNVYSTNRNLENEVKKGIKMLIRRYRENTFLSNW